MADFEAALKQARGDLATQGAPTGAPASKSTSTAFYVIVGLLIIFLLAALFWWLASGPQQAPPKAAPVPAGILHLMTDPKFGMAVPVSAV